MNKNQILLHLNLLNDIDINKLKVLTSIRNCLHNNGIHNHEDVSVVIDSFRYNFIKFKSVNYGGWSHIFNTIMENLRITEKILLSDYVKSIPYIKDDFAHFNIET